MQTDPQPDLPAALREAIVASSARPGGTLQGPPQAARGLNHDAGSNCFCSSVLPRRTVMLLLPPSLAPCSSGRMARSVTRGVESRAAVGLGHGGWGHPSPPRPLPRSREELLLLLTTEAGLGPPGARRWPRRLPNQGQGLQLGRMGAPLPPWPAGTPGAGQLCGNQARWGPLRPDRPRIHLAF